MLRLRALALAVAFASLHACSDPDPQATTPFADGGAPDADGGQGVVGDGGDGGAARDGATTPASMVTTTEAIDVDGVSRKYVLSVPSNYDAKRSYPLVVALHGDGGNASGFVGFSKLEASAGDAAILAFPDQSVDLFTPYDQNRDQKLIEAMVLALKSRYAIDAAKIWGFGYSKGAYQLAEIACRKPGILTAMALHAGGAPQERDANDDIDCPSAIGLPAFVTHGEHDDPGGGEYGAAYWASLAGCQGTRTATAPPICEAYDGCDAGKPVVFCVVPNQPHYPMYDDAAAHSWAWFTSL